MDETLFELIDATGSGCCRLSPEQTIVAASPKFCMLVGNASVVGEPPATLLPELPPLAELPAAIDETPVLVHVVGLDGVRRELAVAWFPDWTGGVLLLGDRSGEARWRRSATKLGHQIDELKAELTAREREPRRPPIRSMPELADRLEEELMRGRRYQHPTSIAVVRLGPFPAVELEGVAISETLFSCVRWLDDLARADDDHWVIVLPHTDLPGGEIVGKRIVAKLGELGLGLVAVGVAQVGLDESGSGAVGRADQVSGQALESGGGVLLAVALV